jgi:hypothetical protein
VGSLPDGRDPTTGDYPLKQGRSFIATSDSYMLSHGFWTGKAEMKVLTIRVPGYLNCFRHIGLGLFSIAFVFSTFPAPELHAADATLPVQSELNSHSIDFLEGKSFKGEIGLPGEPALATDLVIFTEGQFISKGCQEKCGYTSGDYWIRRTGNQLDVKALTPCLTADSTILWEGTVKGDQIEGKFTWTNTRWYWTFEKEFWFKGKLVTGNDSDQSELITTVEESAN